MPSRTRLVLAMVGLAAGSASAAVIGDITRIGYLTSEGDAVRVGAWAPVLIDLSLQNEPSFDGFLRLRQLDNDGDAYVDIVPVHLGADSGAQRRYWLYTPANPGSARQREFQIELLSAPDGDEANATLAQITNAGREWAALTPATSPVVIDDAEDLILSVSDGQMGRVRHLEDREEIDRLARRPHVAHVSPEGIPHHWIGLEMVDYIVWDEADANRLLPEQQRALVDWVRQGGRLMIAAARTADTLAQSDVLAPLLPVKIGTVQSVTALPETRKRLLNDDKSDYPRGIAAVGVTALDLPDVKRVIHEQAAGITLVTSRRIGAGRVTFVAAALNDLLGQTPDPEGCAQFFRRTLELRQAPAGVDNLRQRVSLFRYLEWQTAFVGTGSKYLTVAMLFAVVYVLAATVGVWKFLQNRGMLKHAWTALAVVAAAGSVASIAVVQAAHGVGRRLHQLSIVDGAADSVEARATAYFGLTTSIFSSVDVWLPEDRLLPGEPKPTSCFLRPMPSWADTHDDTTAYTDPRRYRLRPATAEILDVPLRATLKQFEGRWQGTLRGSISGRLALQTQQMPRTKDGEETVAEEILAENSWIQNDLGVDLKSCYLIRAEVDTFLANFGDMSPRGVEAGSPRVYAYLLGELKNGERLDLFRKIHVDGQGDLIPQEERRKSGLRQTQQRWAANFALTTENITGAGRRIAGAEKSDHEKALLLLSTLADLDPGLVATMGGAGRAVFTADRCRHLDLCDLLTTRSALLIGFTNDPGPVRLAVGNGGQYRPAEPSEAWTVYRFVVPIKSGS